VADGVMRRLLLTVDANARDEPRVAANRRDSGGQLQLIRSTLRTFRSRPPTRGADAVRTPERVFAYFDD
jgi:hypothetical protein